jgi:hypothetical protein
MRRRILITLLIAILLLPGFWTVRRLPPVDRSQRIDAVPLPIAQRRVGEVTVEEAWQLTSPNSASGSWSALTVTPERRFTLLSDAAMVTRFTLSPDGRVSGASIRELPLRRGVERRKSLMDSESLTVDPASGRAWIGFEFDTRIGRYTADLSRLDGETRPAAMRHWPRNRGPEAMTHLPDGRLLVLAELPPPDEEARNALLFPHDPVARPSVPPVATDYDRGDRGAVTDAVTLPDGRILILHRLFAIWNQWDCTLAVADSAAIRPGAPWRARTIARFATPGLADNFEGLAVLPDARGGYAIWLVSDDNRMVWQRSLLLRLHWPG